MFPQAGKTALSQKDMQILQTLIASDESADKDLLQVALTVAKARVVVKRPRRAPPILANVQQSYSGRTVRYDVYFHI
jgi:16S rRNA (guanine1516-N2)-methyltransferase